MLRRLLPLVLCCCFVIGLLSGLSPAAEASQGDVIGEYTDSGLGWWVKSDYYVYSSGSSLFTGNRANINRSYTKSNNGPAFGATFVVDQDGYSTRYICILCTVDGSSSYSSISGFNTGSLNLTIDSHSYKFYRSYYFETFVSSDLPLVPITLDSSDSILDISLYVSILESYSGFTTSEPSPPSPSTLFVAGTYNNRSMQVQYGPLVTEPVFTQTETLNASYNLYDAEYTPILSSSDFTGISANLKYQVNPVGYNAEYVCFETMSYSASEYSSIDVSGEFTFYMQSDYYPLVGGLEHRYIFPESAYLYVNGERVYSQVQSLGNGQFRFSGTLNLSELGNIVSIGVWANFTESITQLGATSFDVGFYGDNNLTLTPTAATTVTPDPDATIGDLQVDTQKIEDGINTEIQKQNTIIQQLMSLPQTIGDAISNAFIPDAQLLDDYRDLYGNLLEDRLGFVWQAGTVVLDFVGDMQELLAGIDEDYDLIFPGVQFTMQGQTYELVPRYQVDMENDLMDVLRPTLGTIVGFVCTIAFINTCRDMVISLASGASYMEYIHRREGDS